MSEPPLDRQPTQAELLLTQAEAREISGKLPELDLHGLSEAAARSEINRFLNSLFMEGEAGGRVGKIIFGKGTGKLAQVVREVLESEKQSGLVEVFGPPRHPHEAASAVLVVVVEKE